MNNPNPCRKTTTSPLRAAIKRTRLDWSKPIDRMDGPMKREPMWREVIGKMLDGTDEFIGTWTPDDVYGIDRIGSSVWRYWQACAFMSTGNPDLRSYFSGEHIVRLYTPTQLLAVRFPGTVVEAAPVATSPNDELVGEATSVPHLRVIAGGR